MSNLKNTTFQNTFVEELSPTPFTSDYDIDDIIQDIELQNQSDVSRSNLKVQQVYLSPITSKTAQKLRFDAQLSSVEFTALLVFTLIGAIIFIISALINPYIIIIENIRAGGINLYWFIAIELVLAVLTAHMVYKPYLIEKSYRKYDDVPVESGFDRGDNYVMIALVLYVLMQIIWAVAMFHTRIEHGYAAVTIILYAITTVWLGWVCYHYDKSSIYIFIILLLWTFYLLLYTIDVTKRKWNPISFVDAVANR